MSHFITTDAPPPPDPNQPLFVCARKGCTFKHAIDMTNLSNAIPIGAGVWTILSYQGKDSAKEQKMTFCPPCQTVMETLILEQLGSGAARETAITPDNVSETP